MADDIAPIEGTVRLKPGREKKVRGRYPWVQREEVASADESLTPGCVARVEDSGGGFLGLATYDGSSRFPLRMLQLSDGPIDRGYFERTLRAAQTLRDPQRWETNAYRALFAEADGVPGLIVDRYGEHLAVQVRTLGMERLKPLWLPVLVQEFEPKSIFERSEMASRRGESLDAVVGPLHGETPERVSIEEAGIRYSVPITSGLKTGHYLDQRENRRALTGCVRPGERVLDLFTYSGGFAMAASRGGAEVLGIDILPEMVQLAGENARSNGLQASFESGNAFEFLESADKAAWDWIILDPPAIAKAKDKRDSLKWAVWKLVFNAIPALKPGGMLLVCSCSYQLGLTELGETARLAASDRGVGLVVESVSVQPPDHPYLLQFPESLYLKCLWLRVV